MLLEVHVKETVMAKLPPAKFRPSFPRVIHLCVLLLIAAIARGHWRTSANPAQQGAAQETAAPQTLTYGAPVEREITTGQSHAWQVFLSAGDYCRLSYDTRQAYFRTELFAPGQSRQSGDKPLLSPVDWDVLTTHHDKLRVAAERTTLEAGRLGNHNSTLEGKRQGIVKYEAARALWRELGDRNGQLEALGRIGMIYQLLGEPLLTLRYHGQAIEIAREMGDHYQEANLTTSLGNVHRTLGNNQKALDAYRESRQLFASRSKRLGEAITIESMGRVYLSLGEERRSIEHFNQALRTYRSVGEPFGQSNTLNSLGLAHRTLGENQESLAFHTPVAGFNQGVINDAEQSKGASLRLAATDKAQRLKLDAGFTRSRFDNPIDPLLNQNLPVVPVRETARNAHYLDASYALLKDLKLSEKKTANLTLNIRHERVAPLFRSVAATALADRMQNEIEMTGAIGEITATVSHQRFHDNLADIPSLMKTLSRRYAVMVSIPLASFRIIRPDRADQSSQTDQAVPSVWLPRVAYNMNRIHQFGLAFPLNAGFDSASQVPDQISTNHEFVSEWQLPKWLCPHTRFRVRPRQPDAAEDAQQRDQFRILLVCVSGSTVRLVITRIFLP
jgi:tetratricopeptide (TPR) repeat protein